MQNFCSHAGIIGYGFIRLDATDINVSFPSSRAEHASTDESPMINGRCSKGETQDRPA